MEVSDEELVRRWRADDETAARRLFSRHFRSLYRFFAGKVSGGAEDLVQETWLACVRGRDRLQDDASFRAYMFVTARRILRRHYERGERRAEVDLASQSVADLSPGPSTLHAKRQEDRIILEALRRLPVDYQLALELHDWEGLTGPQLAQVLDIPEGTVRSWIRRGRQQLRAHVEALCDTPQRLQSTLTRLEDWADEIRALVERRSPPGESI